MTTHQQLPEGRYGSRGNQRPRRWVAWLLGAVVLIAGLVAAIVAFRNIGSPPIQGKQSAFQVLDDHSVRITIEVQRDDPGKIAECVVRSRAEDGNEVGRKEILVPPTDDTVRLSTVLRTTTRPVIGEVYGCSYNVPPYLSTTARPSG